MKFKGLNLKERLRTSQLNSSFQLQKNQWEAMIGSSLTLADDSLDHRLSHQQAVDNAFDFDQLETERIFHLTAIKEVATTYRLRFLPLKYFKPQLPYEAKERILSLEKQHGIELNGMHIMAPSKLFKLEDKDDPMLFAPMGNGYYYLIHQWGSDLNLLRKWLVWPFRGPAHLLAVLAALSFVLTLMIPEGMFSKANSSAEFWILFFFFFKGVVGLAIFYGFAMGKNFNPFIWNSKYFNA